jgi:hypothetical protein
MENMEATPSIKKTLEFNPARDKRTLARFVSEEIIA